jgi:50S ribosomal protein L16 3-hydroxylase
MDINQATSLLNGLSPAQFMRLHWQKKPLLVRGAVDVKAYPLSLASLLKLAQHADVQSRYIAQDNATSTGKPGKWQVRHGPFEKKPDKNNALPASKARPWTVLVQGINHHNAAMQQLMQRFRFVPDARLDDVMVSYATPGGGVGPHVDSYDVFLLQLKGTRRWRIGPLRTGKDKALVPDAPIKLLKNFKPTQQYDLAEGDMLYLPPGYGHEGVAMDECLTASVGFRAPRANELVASLLEQLADVVREAEEGAFAQLYTDATQAAVRKPAQLPQSLPYFLQQTWQRIKPSAADFEQIVGAYLSEPKAHVMFDASYQLSYKSALTLAPTSLMLYGKRALFINGEVILFSELSPGARSWLKRLADQREADTQMMRELPADAKALLMQWAQSGYLYELTP